MEDKITINKDGNNIDINDFVDEKKEEDINKETNERIIQLQNKLRETDQVIIDSLKKHFQEEDINKINKQLHTLYAIIAHTEGRYQNSKDYRDAIDMIMGLVIAGKFL